MRLIRRSGSSGRSGAAKILLVGIDFFCLECIMSVNNGGFLRFGLTMTELYSNYDKCEL